MDEAVAATIELESYLKASGHGKSHQTDLVVQQPMTRSPSPEETAAMAGAHLIGRQPPKHLTSTERTTPPFGNVRSRDNSHPMSKSERSGGGKPRRPVVYWNCGEKGHISRACRNRSTEHQGNSSPSVARASHMRGDM